jgi:hypothetical protein
MTQKKCITNDKIVTWTKRGEEAFEDINKAIANCKKMAMFKEKQILSSYLMHH